MSSPYHDMSVLEIFQRIRRAAPKSSDNSSSNPDEQENSSLGFDHSDSFTVRIEQATMLSLDFVSSIVVRD